MVLFTVRREGKGMRKLGLTEDKVLMAIFHECQQINPDMNKLYPAALEMDVNEHGAAVEHLMAKGYIEDAKIVRAGEGDDIQYPYMDDVVLTEKGKIYCKK